MPKQCGIYTPFFCRIFQIQISGFYIKCMSMTNQYPLSFYKKNTLHRLLAAVTIPRHLFHHDHRKLLVQLLCVHPAVSQMNDLIRMCISYCRNHIIYISM